MKREGQWEIYKNMGNELTRGLLEDAMRRVTQRLKEAEEILKEDQKRMIISYTTSRIKTPESIVEKLAGKQKPVTWESAVNNLNDLAGVRAVCLFIDDIYAVRDFIAGGKDMELVKEKDFMKKPKSSGYRSLHMILRVPAVYGNVRRDVKVELQLRTPAMDFWSVLEYQLQYKKKNSKIRAAREELKSCAEHIEKIEERMYELHNSIKET